MNEWLQYFIIIIVYVKTINYRTIYLIHTIFSIPITSSLFNGIAKIHFFLIIHNGDNFAIHIFNSLWITTKSVLFLAISTRFIYNELKIELFIHNFIHSMLTTNICSRTHCSHIR